MGVLPGGDSAQDFSVSKGHQFVAMFAR